MDYAIAPGRPGACGEIDGESWEVLRLGRFRGSDASERLASFAYRPHAEAFLADLIAMESGVAASARIGR